MHVLVNMFALGHLIKTHWAYECKIAKSVSIFTRYNTWQDQNWMFKWTYYKYVLVHLRGLALILHIWNSFNQKTYLILVSRQLFLEYLYVYCVMRPDMCKLLIASLKTRQMIVYREQHVIRHFDRDDSVFI